MNRSRMSSSRERPPAPSEASKPPRARVAEAPLAGRIAVVTGASGRLGPLWVATLAEAGATVVGLDLADADVGGAERVIAADVTDADTVWTARERIESE